MCVDDYLNETKEVVSTVVKQMQFEGFESYQRFLKIGQRGQMFLCLFCYEYIQL